LEFPPAREILSPRKGYVTAENRARMDSQAAGDIAAFIKGEPFGVPNRSRSFETRHAWAIIGEKKPAADGGTAGGRSMCSLRKQGFGGG